MDAISATQARANLFKIMSFVNENSEPVTFTNSKGKNAVLIGEDDWNAIQETIYLNSIPGMVDSLKKGMKTPLDKCVSEKNVKW
ncbi:MAG: type II toxin-antitoxin system Phd/YefM family antitoxin [Treponema sp.]